MERRFWLQKAPRESTEHDGQAVHVWVHGAARTTAGIMKSKGNYRYIIQVFPKPVAQTIYG